MALALTWRTALLLQKKKPMTENIKGLVRPVVTFGIAAALIYGFVSGSLGSGEFLGIAGTVLGFWFRDRNDGEGQG